MSDESNSLLETPPSKIHFLALFSVTMAKLGDSVELVLPAVITQPVSCELSLSKRQEQILALVLYISVAVFSIGTIPFLKKFPRRPIILSSLYMSIIASVLCAAMPDYVSLIFSRIIVGMTVAVRVTPLSVYLSEFSPNKSFYSLATVLSSVGFAIGGGILGYLFLERVGWRWFVLLTSTPLFVLPIILFQFILPESKKHHGLEKDEELEGGRKSTTRTAMLTRIMKISLLNTFRIIPYSGSILLLPALIKEDNIRNDRNSPCKAISMEHSS